MPELDPIFIKGFLAFATMFIIFVGSAWLLLGMILGVRMGYFVMAACFFSTMLLLSAIWFATGLGPKGGDGFLGELGQETAWHAIATGPDLSTVESDYGEYDLSDFPGGQWQEPSSKLRMADLAGEDTTGTELDNVKPVMEGLLLEAVSEIPGKRKEAAKHVVGKVDLVSGEFHVTDVRMREMKIEGKDSIAAVGRAVPSDTLGAGDLGGIEEGEVGEFLVELGDRVTPGQDILRVKAESKEVVLKADKAGRMILFGFKEGDKIKPGVPFATVDVSGQAGKPAPAEVAAVRVRGSTKIPALIYLIVSTLLLAVHLVGLNRTEKNLKPVAQPVSS